MLRHATRKNKPSTNDENVFSSPFLFRPAHHMLELLFKSHMRMQCIRMRMLRAMQYIRLWWHERWHRIGATTEMYPLEERLDWACACSYRKRHQRSKSCDQGMIWCFLYAWIPSRVTLQCQLDHHQQHHQHQSVRLHSILIRGLIPVHVNLLSFFVPLYIRRQRLKQLPAPSPFL